MLASAHIPIYAKSLFKYHRDNYCIDGALTNSCPVLHDSIAYIHITKNMWRNIDENYTWYHISSCKSRSDELFNLGRLDAKNNLYAFDRLVRKSNIINPLV